MCKDTHPLTINFTTEEADAVRARYQNHTSVVGDTAF